MFITLKNAAAVQEPPPPVPMLFKSANGESKINLSLKTENSFLKLMVYRPNCFP